MKYFPVLSLEITHEYYADQRCPDFQILPDPATQGLLRNHRSLVKSFSNGIRILIPVSDEGVPFLPFSDESFLTFELRLRNPDFALFTDLTAILAADIAFYRNSGVQPTLRLDSRLSETTESLAVSRPGEREPFILSGNPRQTLRPSDFAIQGLSAISHPESYDPAAKIITLNSSSVAPGSPFTITYSSTPSPSRDIFARVEISFEDPEMRRLEATKSFRIVFTARSARWKYYVVLGNNTFSPTIEDKENVVSFNERTDLSEVPDPSDEIAEKLITQYPNMRYFRFVSGSVMPCRQTSRKAIQLQLNGEKVVDALPNPSLPNCTIDRRDAQQEISLHHIVRYFTR